MLFQDIEKSNVVLVYKMGNKQLISKVFEKIISNTLFKYLDTNNQINNNESGF